MKSTGSTMMLKIVLKNTDSWWFVPQKKKKNSSDQTWLENFPTV
jgi:hypothetical protein